MARSKEPHAPVPLFAVGNVAVGVIAIGNVAVGIVAIGLSASCGVVAIGVNSIGALALGVNALGPFAGALVNVIGVIGFALVNAIGGVGSCLVNEGLHPILGIVLAVGFLVVGLRLMRQPPQAPVDDGSVPLARLPDLEPGKYTVHATLETGTPLALVDGDQRLALDGAAPELAERLAGRSCACVVEVIDQFEDTEGDYRSAPAQRRRFVLQEGRALVRQWTRARLREVGGRSLVLASIAAGGYCVVELLAQ